MNSRNTRWLQLCILATGVFVIATPDPNFKARFYNSALDFLAKLTKEVVEEQLKKLEFPDVEYNITVGPGTGTFMAEMKYEKFELPKIKYYFTEEGVKYTSKGGDLLLKGRVYADYNYPVNMTFDGWMKVKASDFKLDVTTNISALDHRPQFHIGECSMSLNNFDYEFGGGVVPSWLNMFRKPLASLVKGTISQVACRIATSALTAKYNKLLHILPLRLPIWWKFYLDYAIEEPVYTKKFFDVEAAAVVSYSSKKCNYTAVEQWPEKDLKPKMAVMWVYDSLPNCVLSSVHEGGYLHTTMTKDIPALSTFLQTSCSLLSTCIGKYFKKLRTDYPDKYIDLYLHSYEAPYVEMAGDVVTLFSKYAVDFYINPMSRDDKVLATLILDTSTMMYPAISKNRLVGQVIGVDTKFTAEKSEIGEISKSFLSAFEKAFSGTLKATLKKILQEGLPLPVFQNVTISDKSDVAVLDKFIRINAELEYLK